MNKQLQAIKLALFALALGVSGSAQAQFSGMMPVAAGSYTRGDSLDGTKDELPLAQVYVSAFQMDSNLVTLTLWQQVIDTAISDGYSFTFDSPGLATAGGNPITSINWFDAVKWCNARSLINGLTPCYYLDTNFTMVYSNGNVELTSANVNWTANGFRLPTEAEWEKAARGNVAGQRFPMGNTISQSQAWYTSPGSLPSDDAGPPSTKLAPTLAGSFPTNGFGLHDMAGNVREWCWDWYGTNYYKASPTTDPNGPTSGTSRVNRGGGWFDHATALRCAARNYVSPTSGSSTLGFRSVAALNAPIIQASQSIEFDPANFNPPLASTNLTYPTNTTLSASSSPLDPTGTNVIFQVINPNPVGMASIDVNNVLRVYTNGTFTVIATEPANTNNDSGTNYSAASASLNFMVRPNNLINSVAFNPAHANVIYGSTNLLTATCLLGTTVGFTTFPTNVAIISQKTNLVVKSVGGFTVTASAPQMTNNNTLYLSNSVSVAFTAVPAPLTIAANSTNRSFGQANPVFTVQSSSGFVNGDTFASLYTGQPALTTTATANSLPASYPITTNNTGLPFKSAITNYLVDFVPGTLTIYARTNALSIQFTSLSNPTNLVYGTNITLSATSVPPGASFTFAVTHSTPTNIAIINPTNNNLQVTGVGTFTVAATALAWNGSTGTNYTAATANLNFTTIKARLIVTENASRTVGSTNTTFTPVYSGFANGDGSNALSGSLNVVVTNTANISTPIGTYPNSVFASQNTLTATNYTISFVPGTLTVMSLVNPTTLAAFLGANMLTLAELQFILTNNFTYPTNLDAGTLAVLLGNKTMDTNGLKSILTDNYIHPANVDPLTLADFIGKTNLNTVDTNDFNLFMDYYSIGGILSVDALQKVLGDPNNVVDPAGLNALLAQYITWPGTPLFTNTPPYITACTGGAGQTNYSFTIANFNFAVQFSTDLAHWTNLDVPGQILFTDPNSPAKPGGFYRLLNSTGN